MKRLLVAPLAFTILASSASAATLIAGSGITVTASTVNGLYGALTTVVNGTGLIAGVHGTANNTQWYTGNASSATSWIAFDLGASVVLDSIHVWNGNAGGLDRLGMGTVDIYVSTMLTPGNPEDASGNFNSANWTKLTENVLFLRAPTSNNTGFDLETQTGITLPGTAVRHVSFASDKNFETGVTNYVGLSEVQFFEAAAIPEPNVAALLGGLGMLTLLRRRRH